MNFGSLFVAEILAEVNGGVADNAGDFAFIPENPESAAACRGVVGATDAVESEEASVVDVLDHPTDFVGMGGEHDAAFALSRKGGPGGAIGVAFHRAGGGFQVVCPDALAGHFAAGGAGSFEQIVEEFAFVLGHERGE